MAGSTPWRVKKILRQGLFTILRHKFAALAVIAATLAAALLCLRQLKNGAVSLFKFDPEPHAITLVSLVISIVYDIVMLVMRPEQLMLYNFPEICAIIIEK